MDKLPFSVYDFFAYLSSGTVVLLTVDYVWGLGILEREKIGAVLGIALIILAYVTGQIIGQFSAWLLEYTVVKRVLRRPLSLLMGAKPRLIVFAWVFPGFHLALPTATQHRVNNQAKARGCAATGPGEDLFLHMYSVVTANEKFQTRLDEFRNQYGSARNMCLAFAISAIAILLSHKYGVHPVKLRWAFLAGFAAITLFYRYLKFLRQYSYELLLRYAELPHH